MSPSAMPTVLDPATPCVLRAGPLSVQWSAGDLRYLRMGDREVIRRIYATVRDKDWGTVPGILSDLQAEVLPDRFRIGYTMTHQRDGIHFVWQAEITGEANGTIRFAFDGEAKTSFLRNRIGFCVLHPIRECAGADCRAIYTNGTEKKLTFPSIIAAGQPVLWLHDLAGLRHEVAPGVHAELQFEGDAFEMEDQRNWIDASFKTYCTPLRLPFPLQIAAGTRIKQAVTLRLSGGSDDLEQTPATGFSIRELSKTHRLPALGLGCASHLEPLLEEEVKRLLVIRPEHLRVDLRLWENDWRQRLAGAENDAGQLGVNLEVALHLNEAPDLELQPAAELLAAIRSAPARIIIFQRNRKSTTVEALAAARAVCDKILPSIPLGSGTDADLYQLNLQRPPAEADFISWSMNPQVHATDDASIAETPEAAAQQVTSVRSYYPGLPLGVSPVTLRPRFNPNATGPGPAVPPDQLPPQVDPRQASLFGAAWTLAMFKALAESGAAHVTFYETSGWRGVMERAVGSPLPDQFPSIPGGVFPLYHVLADVGDFAGGEVVSTGSSHPLELTSLLLQNGGQRRLILANISASPQWVNVPMIDGIVLSRVLDSTTMDLFMTHPEKARTGLTTQHGPQVHLAPHAIVTLDFPES